MPLHTPHARTKGCFAGLRASTRSLLAHPSCATRRHLEIDPSHAAARFWLAACTGAAADAAACPPDMVAGLFDQYADKFDSHLVEVLSYRTPQLLL